MIGGRDEPQQTRHGRASDERSAGPAGGGEPSRARGAPGGWGVSWTVGVGAGGPGGGGVGLRGAVGPWGVSVGMSGGWGGSVAVGDGVTTGDGVSVGWGSAVGSDGVTPIVVGAAVGVGGASRRDGRSATYAPAGGPARLLSAC